jgi:hypothetical protein
VESREKNGAGYVAGLIGIVVSRGQRCHALGRDVFWNRGFIVK